MSAHTARAGHDESLAAAGSMWLLAPILLLGATLRFAGLGNSPLWGDEVATLAFANLSWSDLLTGIGQLEPNPPAFYGLLKLWIALAGSSELALRLPSAVLGVAGIAAVYAFARVTLGPRAAGWAGLLMALNPQHLEHARDARVYSALLLVIACAAIAAHRLACLRPEERQWPAAAALAGLAAFAMALHYTGIVAATTVFVSAGVTTLCRPAPLRRLLGLGAAGFAALLLAAPSLATMLAIAADPVNNASWIPFPDGWMGGVLTVSTWTTPFAAIREAPPAEGIRIMLAGLSVVVLVVTAAVSRARRDASTAGLLAGLVASFGLMFGISQVKPIFVEQTLLFSLVFFIPLAGALLAALPRMAAITMLAALLLAQIAGFERVYATTRHNEDWTGLAVAVQQEHAETGWPLVVRSGLDAATLKHFLPYGSPDGAAVSITPLIGARLSDAVARQLAGAKVVKADGGSAALCAAIGHPGGVLLLVWRNALPHRQQQASAALLEQAGGRLDGASSHGILILQRWQGVCAPPATTEAPAAALPRQLPPSAGN